MIRSSKVEASKGRPFEDRPIFDASTFEALTFLKVLDIFQKPSKWAFLHQLWARDHIPSKNFQSRLADSKMAKFRENSQKFAKFENCSESSDSENPKFRENLRKFRKIREFSESQYAEQFLKFSSILPIFKSQRQSTMLLNFPDFDQI